MGYLFCINGLQETIEKEMTFEDDQSKCQKVKRYLNSCYYGLVYGNGNTKNDVITYIVSNKGWVIENVSLLFGFYSCFWIMLHFQSWKREKNAL